MRRIPSRRLRDFVLATLLASSLAPGARAIELPEPFRAAIEQGIANGRYQSIAVALLDHGEQSQWLFGEVAPGGARPTAADAYEIGATTRSFTGLLLAQALLAGKLRLDDTLGRIFSDVHFADPKLAATTIGQLAVHRSGLPALPSNLFPRSVDDPYVAYDSAALLKYLAHAELDANEIGTYRYSDLGVALLGAAIAHVYKSDYRSRLVGDVLTPLGLGGSGLGAVPRLIDGYRDGQSVPHWQYQALQAAGGMRSTLSDLIRFATLQLQPDTSSLRAGILLARQPRASAGGGETALAWQVVPVESDGQSWPLLWQAGVTGGFASFIGFRTDRQRAVVLLGNMSMDLSALGLALVAGRDPPPPPPKRRTTSADAALAYEGLYRFDGGGELVVHATADGLTAQRTGEVPQSMFEYDDDAFELGSGAAQLTFQRDASRIAGATLHQNGMHVRAQRLSEGAPLLKRNLSPLPAASLSVYAGDYTLVSAVRAHVVAAPPGLRVQLTTAAPIFVESCAPDRFCDADGALEVAFTRNRAGQVDALDWRQGVFEASAKRDDW